MSFELEILERFRDIENPKIGVIEDKNIATLKKEELIEECEKLGFNVLNLCRLGNIDPIETNCVKLLQHAMDLKRKAGKRPAAQSGPSGTNGAQGKKQKTFNMLVEKIKILEEQEQLKDKQKNDEVSEFERLRWETKELAAKPSVIMDDLYAKLILLDSSARKVDDTNKEKISMIISRFQAYKDRPKFASALVLKLLSTKEEEIILDKEQKMLRVFGLSGKEESRHSNNEQITGAPTVPQLPLYGQPFYPFPPPRSQAHRAFSQPRLRARSPSGLTCFKCNRPGHFVRDCPSNAN